MLVNLVITVMLVCFVLIIREFFSMSDRFDELHRVDIEQLNKDITLANENLRKSKLEK
jgi:hypothetical protein